MATLDIGGDGNFIGTMSDIHVRICPVCEQESPAQATRCACGASLLSVDFTLKSSSPEEAAPPPVDTAMIGESSPVLHCSFIDCRQPNPPGAQRCLYCNRLFQQADSQPELRSGDVSDAAAALRRLPISLQERYRVIGALPTQGSEADLLLVDTVPENERRVAKLYRHGFRTDPDLMARLARSAGDHVIRVHESGSSEGVDYEVLEYFALGNLRQLIDDAPLAVDQVRAIIAELAQCLLQVQGQHILHRDLKPENVLVRAAEPLSLVLTDFGVASLRMATQHFTGGARTIRYAPPEALTGVLDDKADWWSLGMIAYEAATGKHPFDGLNEQVVNHALATKSVDTQAVFHDDLRKLCRGLLLRDPKRRWGYAEVQRWLEGDSSLAVPVEGSINVALRPYRIGDSQCATAIELAATFSKYWDAARKDLARGSVAHWIQEELHDQNLLRSVQDIHGTAGVSDDWKLLSFILRAAPDIPAVWQGQAISRETLLISARKAADGDALSQAWLHSIHEQKVLELLGLAGRNEVAAFRTAWLNGIKRYTAVWSKAQTAEKVWARTIRSKDGAETSTVVDLDYLLYAQAARMMMPRLESIHPPILLAISLPAYVELLRAEITQAAQNLEKLESWYSSLGPILSLDAVGIMAAKALLPLANEDATLRESKQAAAEEQESAAAIQAHRALMRQITSTLSLARERSDEAQDMQALRPHVLSLHEACLEVSRQLHAPVAGRGETFSSTLESFMVTNLALVAALDDQQSAQDINDIWFSRKRISTGTLSILVILLLMPRWLSILAVAVAAGGYLWRRQVLADASRTVANKLRQFQIFGERMVKL